MTIDELVDKLMIARRTRAAASRCTSATTSGACPGPENTYQSYGTAWANLSNTPFRLYKHWIHEGGISTPLIAHWPNGIARAAARVRHAPGYLPDIMATIVDVTGARVPGDASTATPIEPLEGQSLLPVFAGDDRRRPQADVLGARGQRRGAHRQVEARASATRARGSSTTWTPTAPSCTTSRAQQPERVADMAAQYDAWAERCGVLEREKVVALMKSQGVTRAFWEKDEV